jgi:hypothetical protein
MNMYMRNMENNNSVIAFSSLIRVVYSYEKDDFTFYIVFHKVTLVLAPFRIASISKL